jgi:hypothetical protein
MQNTNYNKIHNSLDNMSVIEKHFYDFQGQFNNAHSMEHFYAGPDICFYCHLSNDGQFYLARNFLLDYYGVCCYIKQ